MIWSLIWKEARAHAWRVLACIAVTVALQLASFAAAPEMVLWMRTVLLYYTPVFGLFLALGPVARERQLRTHGTLLALPVRPAVLWTVKLLTGCAGIVALMLVILGTGEILLACTAAPQATISVWRWGPHIFWPALANALVLYAWMLSASSGSRNELAAGGRILALLTLVYAAQTVIDHTGSFYSWFHYASPFAPGDLWTQSDWHFLWSSRPSGPRARFDRAEWIKLAGQLYWQWLSQIITLRMVILWGYRQFSRAQLTTQAAPFRPATAWQLAPFRHQWQALLWFHWRTVRPFTYGLLLGLLLLAVVEIDWSITPISTAIWYSIGNMPWDQVPPILWIVTLIVGVGAAREFELRRAEFRRSRPIRPSSWLNQQFWLHAVALTASVLLAMLILSVIGGAQVEPKNFDLATRGTAPWSQWMGMRLALQSLMLPTIVVSGFAIFIYSLTVFCAVTLRHSIYAGIFALGLAFFVVRLPVMLDWPAWTSPEMASAAWQPMSVADAAVGGQTIAHYFLIIAVEIALAALFWAATQLAVRREWYVRWNS